MTGRKPGRVVRLSQIANRSVLPASTPHRASPHLGTALTLGWGTMEAASLARATVLAWSLLLIFSYPPSASSGRGSPRAGVDGVVSMATAFARGVSFWCAALSVSSVLGVAHTFAGFVWGPTYIAFTTLVGVHEDKRRGQLKKGWCTYGAGVRVRMQLCAHMRVWLCVCAAACPPASSCPSATPSRQPRREAPARGPLKGARPPRGPCGIGWRVCCGGPAAA